MQTMKSLILTIALAFGFTQLNAQISPSPSGKFFVDAAAAAGGSGDSWATAAQDLGEVIHWARVNKPTWSSHYATLTIYVAEGTYIPSYNVADSTKSPTSRDAAFLMQENVHIYGGYPTGGSSAANRDWVNNPTILSGDIGTVGDTSDNSYHVLISANNQGNSVIDGFTVTLGNANGNGSVTIDTVSVYRNFGGGMSLARSAPTVKNMKFIQNYATTGGGIVNDHSTSEFENITVENNVSNNGGGMFSVESTIVVSNSEFIKNKSIGSNGGGAVNVDTTNSIYNNVHFIGNYSGANGGGLFNMNNSNCTLLNVLFEKDTAYYNGGAIFNSGSIMSIVNTTIVKNSALNAEGGGVSNYDGTTDIYNSILYLNNNDGDNKIENIFNNVVAVTTIYKSIIGGGTTFLSDWGTDGGGTIPTDSGEVNTIFTSPATNDYTILSTSVALDGGDNSYYQSAGGDLSDNNELADQPRLSNCTIDIGAYEIQQPGEMVGRCYTLSANKILYVDENASGNGDGQTWTNAIKSVSSAIRWVRQKFDESSTWLGTDSLQIYVAKGKYEPHYGAEDGNYTTDQGENNAYVLMNNVQLYGGFDPASNIKTLNDQRIYGNQGTILSGDLGVPLDMSDNTYHVLIAAGSLGNAVVDGFTIAAGNARGTATIPVNGEAISQSIGGGVVNNNATIRYVNSTISSNSSNDDGGGMINIGSSPKIINSAFIANAATNGGGIKNESSSSPVFVNVTIAGNQASQDGGGVNNDNSTPSFYNSILYNNTASNGGNILNATGTSQFYFSLVGGSGSWDTNWGVDNGNNIALAGGQASALFHNPAGMKYDLIVGSQAINAGNNTDYQNYGGDIMNDIDLAGFDRVLQAGASGIIDMGAYEFQYISEVVYDSICVGDSYQLPGGSSVTNPGNYTDTLTTVTPHKIVLTHLSNYPNPNVILNTNSPVCKGTTLTITTTSAGNYTYSWTGPDGFTSTSKDVSIDNVTSVNQGKYYITATTDKGCSVMDSADIIVEVVDVSVTDNSPTLNANATGANYQWLDCDDNLSPISGAINPSYTATKNGNYAVQITQNGCIDTSECISITGLAVIENTLGSHLDIYPNPTNGEFLIDFNQSYTTIEMTIKNVLGQFVQNKTYTSASTIKVALEGKAGVYFVHLKSDNKTAVIKVIKID